MQVTSEQRTPCEVELTIEVGTDRVAQAINNVYRELSQTTSIPGFRKGKTPRQILEKYISPESVRRRTIETVIPDAYHDAVHDQDIHPYTDPEIEVVQFEDDKPFIFKAVVPLPPTVKLGEYKGIEEKREVREITDADVEEQLKQLQESRATSRDVEGRGVQAGDFVIAEVSSRVGDEEMPPARRTLIEIGSNIPGFDDNILGMEPEQRRTFALDYPADHPDESLAGKTADFDVAVHAIKEKVAPEMDYEFAKSIGKFETIDELKADIRKHMIESAEQAADREVEGRIIDEIVSRSEVCFPEIMVEHDVYHDMEELQQRLSRQGATIHQYLQQTGKSQDDLLN